MRALIVLLLALGACARPPGPQPVIPLAPATERTFRMGFTTAPGGSPGAGQNDAAATIGFVRTNGDFLVVHRDGPPVPWADLASGRVERFRDELAEQRRQLGAGLPLFVAITPLNIFRNAIGGKWPARLGRACVANPQLRSAFERYAQVIVEAMEPQYLALGTEVNMYQLTPAKGCPGDFDAYVSLYKETYHLVKAMRPDLPVFVTFQLDFLHLNQRQMLPARFLPELDRLAISLYPGGNLTRLEPADIPADYISWARVATDAPLVVAETGYGSKAAGGAVGSPELQAEYVQWLLAQAQREHAEFVTWFFSSDPRHVKIPRGLDYMNSFLSMGLVTPDLAPKPALDVWRSYLALPLAAEPPLTSTARRHRVAASGVRTSGARPGDTCPVSP